MYPFYSSLERGYSIFVFSSFYHCCLLSSRKVSSVFFAKEKSNHGCYFPYLLNTESKKFNYHNDKIVLFLVNVICSITSFLFKNTNNLSFCFKLESSIFKCIPFYIANEKLF